MPGDANTTAHALDVGRPPSRDVAARRLRERLTQSLVGQAGPVCVGRYQLGVRLGAGGMGVVYRAYDPELRRDVAIKLVPLPADRDPERTMAEARAMASVRHPNVVTVYDVGRVGDELYVVMELIDGTTLREWGTAKRTLDELLDAMRAAGMGLAAAHAVGIVHRDFKPDNVLVASDGRVAVTDFGLAALVETAATDPSPTDAVPVDSQTTNRTAVSGTPGYMAPERWAGQRGDARLDQYAWAITVFELAFGKLPFKDHDPRGLVARIPDRGQYGPVGHRVRRVLSRALAQRPSDRFETLPAAMAALSPSLPRKLLWPAAALATAALVAIVSAPGGAEVAPCRPDAPAGSAEACIDDLAPDAPLHVLPDDPAMVSPVARARVLLAEALAFDGANDVDMALAKLDAAEAILQDVAFDPAHAELALARGEIFQQVGRNDEALPLLERAVSVAVENGEYVVAAQAASHLAHDHGMRLRNREASARWGRAAVAYAERAESFTRLGTTYGALGDVALFEGRHEDARRYQQKALDIYIEVNGSPGRNGGVALSVLGTISQLEGDLDEAERLFQRSREAIETWRPEGCLALMLPLNNLAELAVLREQPQRAVVLFDEALDIASRMRGPDSLEVGTITHNSAEAWMALQRPDEAERRYARGVELFSASLGAEHPFVAEGLTGWAEALATLDRNEEAKRTVVRALRLLDDAPDGAPKTLARARTLHASLHASH